MSNYSEAYDAGYDEGKDDGYDYGYKDGYEDGHEVATTKCLYAARESLLSYFQNEEDMHPYNARRLAERLLGS